MVNLNSVKIFGVPGIGQKIEIQDRRLFPLSNTQNEVGPDESGASRNQPTLKKNPLSYLKRKNSLLFPDMFSTPMNLDLPSKEKYR